VRNKPKLLPALKGREVNIPQAIERFNSKITAASRPRFFNNTVQTLQTLNNSTTVTIPTDED